MNNRIIFGPILVLLLAPSIFAATTGRLCFTRGAYIFVREPNGVTKRVVKGRQPNISPDGKTIAFVTGKGELLKSESHVHLIDIQTGKLREISSLTPYDSFGPLWSPDGRRLAVQLVMDQKGALATVDPRTGDFCVIPANLPRELTWLNSWTPDGNSLVLNDLEYVYQLTLSGQVLRSLSIKEMLGDVVISSQTGFSFSPDGRFLLFDSAMVPDDVGIASIYLYNFTSGGLSRLTSDRLGALDPQWIPGGTEIIFTGYVKGRYKLKSSLPYYAIYRISADGKNLTMIMRNAENASYALQ